MPHPQDKAIAHVATLAAGKPADPSWRVTLHFHPGQLARRADPDEILQLMAHDGVYRSQFDPAPATGA